VTILLRVDFRLLHGLVLVVLVGMQFAGGEI
jgi:hypothetical protein